MKNIPTQVARNGDFYPRPKIINKIYRRINSNSHIFLAAPRKVGKTSIMRHLEDYPKEKYCFVYVMLEDVYDIEVFYYEVMDALMKSKLLSSWSKGSKTLQDKSKSIFNRIKQINIPVIGGGIELNQSDRQSYQKKFDELLDDLADDKTKIILMLDEFPQALENIKAKHGTETAKQFLQTCRKQRQTCPENVRFIYTGSIGLPYVVSGIASSNVINDLNTAEVPPMSPESAIDMATQILTHHKVMHDADMLPYLMERLQWLIPFHIQLALQEVIDIHEDERRNIIKNDVDEVLRRLLNYRNDRYFSQYKERLETAFSSATTFNGVIELLNDIAKNGFITKERSKEILNNERIEDDYDRVIESLQFDGYIYFNDEKSTYQFTSQLLKMWWEKFVLN